MSEELRKAAEKAVRLLDLALGDTDPNIEEWDEDSGLTETEWDEQMHSEHPAFFAHLILSEAIKSIDIGASNEQ